MSQIDIKDFVPEDEYMTSGHLACPGCGGALAMRMVLKAMGPRTIIGLPACCWTIVAGPWPQASLKVPLYHTAFETAAALASGIKAALDVRGDTETQVIAWAGDGGTLDIGIQALSGAAERNEDFLYCCYDNEAYMNTGIQRSSATPWGAWTTTTPEKFFENRPKKDLLAIMAAHRIPYAATASIAYPEDLIAKARKARSIRGTKLLHILCPCPPGWKAADEETIELARMAVQTRVFPLMEVEDGVRWRLSMEHRGDPVGPYIRKQGRFRHLSDYQVAQIQTDVNTRWESLMRRVEHGT
ncbi:MAG TPA: thiamine pyrophosphate-dependent enzyme [Candidatus Saccharimonadales bacterium]|nr:thiamine pyrophosphate-dependent enzyme [Candidatus Saccharimonadales bacterium]